MRDSNFVHFPPATVEDLDKKLAGAGIAEEFQAVGEIALRAKEHPEPMVSKVGALVCDLLTTASTLQDDPAAIRTKPTGKRAPSFCFERPLNREVGQKIAVRLCPRLLPHSVAARAARLECYDALPGAYALCMYVDMEPNQYVSGLFGSVFVTTTVVGKKRTERNGLAFIKGFTNGRSFAHDTNTVFGRLEDWRAALAAPNDEAHT